jgi:hypothetical protein
MAGLGLAGPPGDDSWEPLTPTRPCDATDRTRTVPLLYLVRGSSRTPGEATVTAKMTNSKLLYRYLPNDPPPEGPSASLGEVSSPCGPRLGCPAT